MLFVVYMIKNELNGKCYIGRTKNFHVRKQRHLLLSQVENPKYYIHRAIKKYGIDNFTFSILKNNISIDDINEEEINFIKIYDSYNNGYNMTIGGDGKLQYITTEETKNKIRIHSIKNGKENYIKRNKTLYEKDKDFLKTIGAKSSNTQKKNGKHKDLNNANANHNKILLFDGNGDLIDTFLRIDVKNLDKNRYPVRMIYRCLQTHNRMFHKMYNGNGENWLKYTGWHCCYENECWINLN